MKLQESIYVKDVRVKINDILRTNRDRQSLDDAIINVQDGMKSYTEEPPFLLKIGDKYEILDGFHRIAQEILYGKQYIISDVMIKESNMNLQESIRRILREVFDSKSTFKRNVYGGEEEYREVTKNRTVIWNPEYKIAFQYIFDDRELPGYTFVHLYPYTEGRYNYQWEELDNSVKSKIFIDAIKKLPKVLKNYFKKFGKVDNIVFRPKTEQMGNIYSSPSVIRILQSEFGSDYNIEVNQEDKKSLPVNTVIMTLKNIVKESEDDFDWIKDVNPSLLDSIIIFEPMITEEEYSKVLNILENSGENIHTNTGHNINTLDPFRGYDYLHHLLININGKTVYGGSNDFYLDNYEDLYKNLNEYTSIFSDVFPNPTRINGRDYFNI